MAACWRGVRAPRSVDSSTRKARRHFAQTEDAAMRSADASATSRASRSGLRRDPARRRILATARGQQTASQASRRRGSSPAIQASSHHSNTSAVASSRTSARGQTLRMWRVIARSTALTDSDGSTFRVTGLSLMAPVNARMLPRLEAVVKERDPGGSRAPSCAAGASATTRSGWRARSGLPLVQDRPRRHTTGRIRELEDSHGAENLTAPVQGGRRMAVARARGRTPGNSCACTANGTRHRVSVAADAEVGRGCTGRRPVAKILDPCRAKGTDQRRNGPEPMRGPPRILTAGARHLWRMGRIGWTHGGDTWLRRGGAADWVAARVRWALAQPREPTERNAPTRKPIPCASTIRRPRRTRSATACLARAGCGSASRSRAARGRAPGRCHPVRPPGRRGSGGRQQHGGTPGRSAGRRVPRTGTVRREYPPASTPPSAPDSLPASSGTRPAPASCFLEHSCRSPRLPLRRSMSPRR